MGDCKHVCGYGGCCENCGVIIVEAYEELEADNKRLRRGVDNIKIRAYELGQRELHDMALAALQGEQR